MPHYDHILQDQGSSMRILSYYTTSAESLSMRTLQPFVGAFSLKDVLFRKQWENLEKIKNTSKPGKRTAT